MLNGPTKANLDHLVGGEFPGFVIAAEILVLCFSPIPVVASANALLTLLKSIA